MPGAQTVDDISAQDVNIGDKVGNDNELRKEITNRFKICEIYYKDWTEEAEEDYRFGLGDQWTEEERAKLEDQGRPILTFNRIRSLINIVAGHQRENAARIRISPEGGEDEKFSDVMDRGFKAIDKWSKLSYKLGYQFDDGLYCGKGFLEGYKDYTKDPIRGDLKFKLLGPYKVLVDPDCDEYDMNEGAEYLFKYGRYTKSKLKSMYPKQSSMIDGFCLDTDDPLENMDEEAILKEGDADNYGNEPNSATVVTTQAAGAEREGQDVKFGHKEYWRKKYVTKYFIINRETGLPERFDSEDEAREFINNEKERLQPIDEDLFQAYSGEIKIIDRQVPEMWVAAQVCGHILQDIKSPFEPLYSGFPFFRYLADWTPSAKDEKHRVMGIVRQLKDPQKEKNRSKSQFLHILSTQSNSGWIGEKDALTKQGWLDLKKLGSSPGVTIKTKKGSALREIEPKAPAMAQIIRENSADGEFTQISGVNPDLLGVQDKTTSGRAIALRMKQAVVALVRMLVNYRYTKETIGVFILKIMPEIFDSKRLSKVIGQKFMVENEVSMGMLTAYLQMVKDQKYDVEVSEADNTSTVRAEIFEQLIELAKTPYGQQIPLELILEYMEIGDKESIKKKIAATRQQQAEAEAAGNK